MNFLVSMEGGDGQKSKPIPTTKIFDAKESGRDAQLIEGRGGH
jgi:hypothetical protein